jgi:hypothetical protein
MTVSLSGAQPVVVRFLDGRILKGTTRDFAPNKPKFHLFPWGEEGDKALEIIVGALKAVFFVKSYQGDKSRVDDNSFEQARGQGRKLAVTFQDGEVLAGFTMGYNPKNQGFFLVPADEKSNNSRVYILNSAVSNVEPVTGAPAAGAASTAT